MTVVATLPKNSREEVRVSLTSYRGHQLVDVRVYAGDADAERVPTPKGLALRPSFLPPLIEALRAALAAFEASGRMVEGGGR
jgi:hypothetical protein